MKVTVHFTVVFEQHYFSLLINDIPLKLQSYSDQDISDIQAISRDLLSNSKLYILFYPELLVPPLWELLYFEMNDYYLIQTLALDDFLKHLLLL